MRYVALEDILSILLFDNAFCCSYVDPNLMPPPGGVLVRNKSRDTMTSSSHTVTKATDAKMAAASAAAAQASVTGGKFFIIIHGSQGCPNAKNV